MDPASVIFGLGVGAVIVVGVALAVVLGASEAIKKSASW